MNTVELLTRDSTASFCNFAFSPSYIHRQKSSIIKHEYGMEKRTPARAIFVTKLLGSSKLSIPSEAASC